MDLKAAYHQQMEYEYENQDSDNAKELSFCFLNWFLTMVKKKIFTATVLKEFTCWHFVDWLTSVLQIQMQFHRFSGTLLRKNHLQSFL